MEIKLIPPEPVRISTSPPGRGLKQRPDINVNIDYVRTLLEQNRLTERDEEFLRWLDELAVMSSRQIKTMFWPGSTPSNMSRRLRALYDYHLLDRVRMLKKEDGITYCLGKAGQLWLHGERRGGNPPRVNVALLSHDLIISEVAVKLVTELRHRDPTGQKFGLSWVGESKARFVKDERVLEPDARIRLNIAGNQKYQWYLLEIDMSTERAAAFENKVKRYNSFAPVLRDENRQLPVVLVIAPTPARIDTLIKVIAGQPGPLTWALNPLPTLIERGFYGQQLWTVVINGQTNSAKLWDL